MGSLGSVWIYRGVTEGGLLLSPEVEDMEGILRDLEPQVVCLLGKQRAVGHTLVKKLGNRDRINLHYWHKKETGVL